MLVGTHQKIAKAGNLEIDINNAQLERVNDFKYLWAVLDQHLSWKDHVEHIGNKILSRLGVLR